MTWGNASLNAGAVMADASLNRRQKIRVGAGVAVAQVGIVGFDRQIELEALRLSVDDEFDRRALLTDGCCCGAACRAGNLAASICRRMRGRARPWRRRAFIRCAMHARLLHDGTETSA
jgi:hypothetical protein